MPERVLTTRELNRALLARQFLLARSRLPLTRALEQVGGLQTQYAPSAYIGLWSRLERLALADLTRALEQRRAVQATLMRDTIHVVSRRDYWPFALGTRRARREWWLRVNRGAHVQDAEAAARRLRAVLAERPRRRAELDEALGTGGRQGEDLWLDVVRVPPSGTWERRRADLYAAAEDWIGPPATSEEEALDHLVRRYLGGFGPASRNDIASWSGVPVTLLRATLDGLRLRRFRDEAGRELLDLPRAPLPGADVPAPVRFLPTWDANLLVHARRTQILPEPYRAIIFHTRVPHSFPTFLVDGAVAGTWRAERAGGKATLVLEAFEPIPRTAQVDLRSEGGRLIRFVEPEATSYAVTLARRAA